MIALKLTSQTNIPQRIDRQLRCIDILYIFVMEKPQATRHWKDIHLRKDSADSLNDSMHSNKSSLSSGYNRFHFKRQEDQPKKSAVFHFAARNRENPHDISLLSKRSQDKEMQPPRESSAAPRINTLERMVRRINSLTVDKDKRSDLTNVMKQVKFIISSLKKTFDYLQKQMKEMQFQWDVAMHSVARKQMEFQNREIKQLKTMLQEKEKEIQRLNQASSLLPACFGVARAEARVDGSAVEPLIVRNAVSVVDSTRANQDRVLERNTTLSSLLGHQSRMAPSFRSDRSKKQLTLLRQTMKRMKDMLGGEP